MDGDNLTAVVEDQDGDFWGVNIQQISEL